MLGIDIGWLRADGSSETQMVGIGGARWWEAGSSDTEIVGTGAPHRRGAGSSEIEIVGTGDDLW